MPILNLTIQPGRLAVCQLPADAAMPAWLAGAKGFVSLSRTDEELSIVCPEDLVPADVKQEPGWRACKVEGPLGFGLTGIMASVLDPLADAKVSVFAISTYNTDYVLVKDAKVADAVAALRNSGHTVRLD
jgi:hypothetical protein